MQTSDGQKLNVDTFLEFLEGFAGGEVASELTIALAKATRATTDHYGKSTFTLTITVEQMDESMFGQLLISPKIVEKPARAQRAGAFKMDPESGQLQLG